MEHSQDGHTKAAIMMVRMHAKITACGTDSLIYSAVKNMQQKFTKKKARERIMMMYGCRMIERQSYFPRTKVVSTRWSLQRQPVLDRLVGIPPHHISK